MLFEASATDVELSEFNAQELANTAWALAAVNLSDERLFKVLAREAKRRVSVLKVQNLANTAWAFATVNLLDETLFRALATEAELRISESRASGGVVVYTLRTATTPWPWPHKTKENQRTVYIAHRDHALALAT